MRSMRALTAARRSAAMPMAGLLGDYRGDAVRKTCRAGQGDGSPYRRSHAYQLAADLERIEQGQQLGEQGLQAEATAHFFQHCGPARIVAQDASLRG
jgi:hypothetical protein